MSKPAKTTRNLRNVAADDLSINLVAQREFRPAWANQILANFDPEKFQTPYVNRRPDGSMFIIEGQHGVWAYRHFYGEGAKVQVWLYEGLTEEQEADMFLSLNNKKPIDAMAKFKVGVTAGRPEECDIDRIVRANGCVVGTSNADNSISAVSTLTTIYNQHGGVTWRHAARRCCRRNRGLLQRWPGRQEAPAVVPGGRRRMTCSLCGSKRLIIAGLSADWWACPKCDLMPMNTEPEETP